MDAAQDPLRPPSPRPGRVALGLYVTAVVVYALLAGDRLRSHSPDNHFSYLADSLLHGTLAVRCDPAVTHGEVCPPGNGGNDWAQFAGRWFVAFPAFPAVVYLPFVALWGRNFPNRVVDVLVAGVAPALLYLLLEKLCRKGYSARSWRDNLGLCLLFAFGSVYFFSAVQGSVWFTAHLVGCALFTGFLYFSLDAARPLAAGALLAAAFHTRTPMLLGALFFGLEALRVNPRADAPAADPAGDTLDRLAHWARTRDLRAALRPCALFSLPVLAALGLYLLLNKLRFGDYSEPGYRYLQILWHDRILKWGLFNYHYLSRNLAVALALLPWISRTAPYIQVSRHGLALWVTTPQFLELARPGRGAPPVVGLAVTAAAIAALDLLYQNSGWVQFGYRFSNDFSVLLVVLVALTGRPWRRLAWSLLAVAVAVNLFGAATFERPNRVYVGDNNAAGMFQPD